MSEAYQKYLEYLGSSEKKHKIGEVYLLELLPENLRNDPDIIAASLGVDKEFWSLVESINNYVTISCFAFTDIDKLSPEVKAKLSEYIDYLAREMKVDFYDEYLDLEKRLALVKNGYLYKYRKGTAYAVKQIVTDAFDQTTLKEWFEYNGNPFRFKLITEANLHSESKITDLVNTINSVKNARSTLETIEVIKRTNLKGYYGFGIQQTFYHNIKLI